MKSGLKLILLGMLLMGLGACQTNPFKSGDAKLDDIMTAYKIAVRWGAIANTYQFLTPELRVTAEVPDNLDNIRVTTYQVVSGPGAISENLVTQTVLIEYVYQDQQVLKKLVDEQLWKYVEADDVWYRANPVPPM